MRLVLCVCALAACLLVAPFARGQVDERGPLSQAVAALTLPRAQYEAMLDKVAGSASRSVQQQGIGGKSLPQDFAERFRAECGKALPYEAMIEQEALLLAKNYTVGEMRQLADFYKSPVGQKSVQIMPEILMGTQGWVQSRVDQELPSTLQRIRNGDPAVRHVTTSDPAGGE